MFPVYSLKAIFVQQLFMVTCGFLEMVLFQKNGICQEDEERSTLGETQNEHRWQ